MAYMKTYLKDTQDLRFVLLCDPKMTGIILSYIQRTTTDVVVLTPFAPAYQT